MQGTENQTAFIQTTNGDAVACECVVRKEGVLGLAYINAGCGSRAVQGCNKGLGRAAQKEGGGETK